MIQPNTTNSAQVLRQVFVSIKLEATYPEIGKPYYAARNLKKAITIVENRPIQNV